MAKYCEEIVKEIEAILSNGISNKTACEIVVIDEDTFYEWMKKPEFSERVKKAKATGKASLVQIIRIAAQKQWQAAAWSLERIWPDEFGKKLELAGNPDKPLKTETVLRPATKKELKIARDLIEKEC